MRATMVAMLVFCAGCFDYSKLSTGSVAEVPDMSDGKADGQFDGDGAVASPADLAGLDLLGVDLAGWDGAQPVPDMTPFYPATCLDVRTADASAVDGTFTLYAAKNPVKPWTVFCKDMASTPKEYLSLVNTGTDQNFSQYTVGGYATGTSVRTNYTRIRVDPVTLKVNVSDQTYSSSTGTLSQAAVVTSMPYAVAMDCLTSFSSTGLGNVDLRGTPFTIKANAFNVAGNAQGGGATLAASGSQIAMLTGGGLCGWCAAGGYAIPGTGPVNTAGGFQLQLNYP
jgi:hypothetical protein